MIITSLSHVTGELIHTAQQTLVKPKFKPVTILKFILHLCVGFLFLGGAVTAVFPEEGKKKLNGASLVSR